MKNIVIALDGSAESLEAAKLLQRLPFKERPKITVVTALVDAPFDLVSTDSGLQLREAEKIAASDTYHAVEAGFREVAESVEQVIEREHPNHLILQIAKKRDADLIVLGARGHNAIYRTVLGSTADHIAASAKTSVLIVRPNEQGEFVKQDDPFRVLLAYDGSEESKHAYHDLSGLDWPAESSDFIVAHILERPKLVPEDVVYDQGEIEKAEQELQDLTEAWNKDFSVQSVVRESMYIGNGLENLVVKENRNLLFVGGTGKSALQRFFLGSTSRHLLHHAECPIWIAREKRY